MDFKTENKDKNVIIQTPYDMTVLNQTATNIADNNNQ